MSTGRPPLLCARSAIQAGFYRLCGGGCPASADRSAFLRGHRLSEQARLLNSMAYGPGLRASTQAVGAEGVRPLMISARSNGTLLDGNPRLCLYSRALDPGDGLATILSVGSVRGGARGAINRDEESGEYCRARCHRRPTRLAEEIDGLPRRRSSQSPGVLRDHSRRSLSEPHHRYRRWLLHCIFVE